MRRYSLAWWLAILPTSIITAAGTFLVLGQLSDWGLPGRSVAAAVSALIVDLAIAAWVEQFAPTKVIVGPAERAIHSDDAAENATVIGGFGSSPLGRVMVRGETWPAVRSADETGNLVTGMVVKVVDRVGLRLVVSARPE